MVDKDIESGVEFVVAIRLLCDQHHELVEYIGRQNGEGVEDGEIVGVDDSEPGGVDELIADEGVEGPESDVELVGVGALLQYNQGGTHIRSGVVQFSIRVVTGMLSIDVQTNRV